MKKKEKEQTKSYDPVRINHTWSKITQVDFGCISYYTTILYYLINKYVYISLSDNLDTGKEVVPIITRYEGFVDCFHSIITEEGVGGLFKGFGALMLQYAVQIAILRISFVSLKEILKVFNPQTDIPTEYVEMHGGGAPEVRPVQNQNQMEESRPVKQQPQQSESPNTIRRRIMNQSQNF